jgi:hypothetical protein
MINAGAVTTDILEGELHKLNYIETLINRIVFLRGISATGEMCPAQTQELADLATELLERWNLTASLDYLRDFDRQVSAEVFFDELVVSTRDALTFLQVQIKAAESKQKKEWTAELSRLKAEGFAVNFDRICFLESALNDLSEKFVSDRLSNFIKTENLNSEKMTPRFLRIAETQCDADLSVVKDNNGRPFVHNSDRNNFITNFYEDLYKIPADAQNDFTGCVENFLGDLINHPVIRGCKLSEEEAASLEAGLTIEELDEAVKKCNTKSAPGIDGISNNFIKKFWPYFRVPLYEYTCSCAESGTLTPTFRTALIKLIPKKGDTTMIKNWRPISLLSCFYKIWSKAVDARLEKIIGKVTSLSQKAYNKKRYIQESLINTIDTIRHCEHNGVGGAILAIDQKKAFDSVYHGYMREVYRFFGFGPDFIKLLETIGTNRTARIIFCDNQYSGEISLERGFAQGNSPSPKKYNIGEQILIFRLEFDPSVAGVYNSFLIPRSVVEDETQFPMIEQAVGAGLVVDDELKETERRNSAFADE